MKYMIIVAFLLCATLAYQEDSKKLPKILEKRWNFIEVLAVFDVFDANDNGKLERIEIYVIWRLIGKTLTKAQMEKIVQQADADDSGTIDFGEFSTITEVNQDTTLRTVFGVFDTNGDGYITANELQRVMANISVPLTDGEVDEKIKAKDKDGDGQVNYKEFAKPRGHK